MKALAKNASNPGNQARLGLYIVCGITLSGLILLMVAEAAGGHNWPFNLFLLVAGAALWVYAAVVFRSHQSLWAEVSGSERGQADVENILVQSLDRLRAGDLVNCADHARELPGRVSVTFGNATNSLDVLAQQIQRSSIEVAAAANSVNEIASELASGSSEQAA
ncbi:MAG: hypothetical protein ABUL63_03350, partial [Acidobacteriota bacterium]